MIVCSWGTCWLKFGFTLTIARIVGELGELTTPKTIVIVDSRHIYSCMDSVCILAHGCAHMRCNAGIRKHSTKILQ